MYKLVIIDDEPLIRQGLRAIINWSSYDIELCGEADNGIDGLRLCQELKPDVAIVDIKMPGLNGLQVIEQSKKLGLHIDFIVLSGYSEFAYAQKATEFGVRCYLLKPIEQTEIIQKIKLFREEWKDSLQREGGAEGSAQSAHGTKNHSAFCRRSGERDMFGQSCGYFEDRFECRKLDALAGVAGKSD